MKMGSERNEPREESFRESSSLGRFPVFDRNFSVWVRGRL